MQALNMIFYTGLTLGILIFIHELGHFLAAKLMGMKVDRFSIGFPPRAFGKKIGDTDYCISWVPIGGYVKIAGMVDESFDTEFLDRAPQPWEFRAKPLRARMLVISAGVIMNVLLAFAIFSSLHFSSGRTLKQTTEIGFVADGSAAMQAGLRPGDVIQSVNGRSVSRWEEIQNAMYLENMGEDIEFTVMRDGASQRLTALREMIPDPSREPFGMIEAHTAPVIRTVEPGKPAEKLGLKPGDLIMSLNDTPVSVDAQVIAIVKAHADKELSITWKHDDELKSGLVTPNEEGRIGIAIASAYVGPSEKIDYSLIEAVSEGARDVGQVTSLFFQSIAQLINGKAAFKDSFGGPIKIAQYATQSAETGLVPYLGFMAMLSMSLALLNILPIPALDGGHLVMMLYEKVARREIPNRIKIAIQQTGFILLLAFMAFVIYNDIAHF